MSLFGGLLLAIAVIWLVPLICWVVIVALQSTGPVGMRAPWPAPDYQRMLDVMLDDASRAWAAAQPRPAWAPPVVREREGMWPGKVIWVGGPHDERGA